MQVAEHLEALPAQDMLRWALANWGREFAIVTSFQPEGMVLVDMAARIAPTVRVVTIDTGRLPQETYQMMEEVEKRYGVRVEVVMPDSREVVSMVNRHGVNLFRQSPSMRKFCCQVRKVLPLDRKCEELMGWAVGLRRGQSGERAGTPKVQEMADGRYKLSPLADWSESEVAEYSLRNEVPRHPLLDQGYTTIGCISCTRATLPGEDPRAGRWWWEMDQSKECGLHVSPQGEARRDLDVLLDDILVR